MNVSSFNASHSGSQAHAWTITFMSITGDVGELVLNGTEIVSGEVAVTERVKVRNNEAFFGRGTYRRGRGTHLF